MKKLLILPFLLILISMYTVKKTKIVFFGDSITQAGVKKGGYIDRIQKSIDDAKLTANYELIGAGIGGNKVYDLYLRMDDDVLAKDPQVVVVYVGINDVWHKTTSGTGTDKDKYEKFYIALIKKLQAKNIKVALCTPTVIGEKKDNANPQDADLNAYSDVIRKLATSYNCTLIDLRKAFQDYEQANNGDNKESGLLTTDRVHLTDAGNQLVADEMTRALAIR
ncbi:SGNH/GDSL hydrolase family protein [Terrimonas pollutisoli]|uniref:SGNH/GDSL hydrolase family protein n=1 Tax=Terrimonas pollutisoli TaxID=3034147 RepID=UPI0023EC7F60|nr:SGNH/GDSL hydrolase family protein [Terrimonas sp. H1YJ31]